MASESTNDYMKIVTELPAIDDVPKPLIDSLTSYTVKNI